MLLCGVGSRLMAFNYRDGTLTASGFLVCGFLVCRIPDPDPNPNP